MRRASVVLLLTAAALVSMVSTAAAHPQRGFVFSLHAAGFGIQGRAGLGSDRVRLLLARHGKVAYYNVKARVGAGTVRARFGGLGTVDLRFVPGRGEGEVGCGDSEGRQEGAFVGRIVFRGEHDYADVDARRAQGWFQTYPSSACGRGKQGAATASGVGAAGAGQGPARASSVGPSPSPMRASASAPIAETGARIEGRTSSRFPYRWIYISTDNGHDGVRNLFDGFSVERREGMRIERGAQVYGGAASFEWNLAAGTARVEPPAPFSGRAFYREDADGRPSWTGSLEVPILGGAPLRLTGPQLNARLLPGSPFA